MKLKISSAKEPGRGMAVCEGAMRDGKLVAPVEFAVGEDGAYTCEIVNKSWTLSFFAGGEEVYSMPSPGFDEEIAPGEEHTGFVPAIFLGKIDEIWLEMLK